MSAEVANLIASTPGNGLAVATQGNVEFVGVQLYPAENQSFTPRAGRITEGYIATVLTAGRLHTVAQVANSDAQRSAGTMETWVRLKNAYSLSTSGFYSGEMLDRVVEATTIQTRRRKDTLLAAHIMQLDTMASNDRVITLVANSLLGKISLDIKNGSAFPADDAYAGRGQRRKTKPSKSEFYDGLQNTFIDNAMNLQDYESLVVGGAVMGSRIRALRQRSH
jgi:hypothetical protein